MSIEIIRGATRVRPPGALARAFEFTCAAIGIARHAARRLAWRPRRKPATIADLAQLSDARLRDVGLDSDAGFWRDMRPDPWAHLHRWRS